MVGITRSKVIPFFFGKHVLCYIYVNVHQQLQQMRRSRLEKMDVETAKTMSNNQSIEVLRPNVANLCPLCIHVYPVQFI